MAALPIIAQALSQGNVQWSDIGRTALAAASVATLLALGKYAKAHGDPAPIPQCQGPPQRSRRSFSLMRVSVMLPLEMV